MFSFNFKSLFGVAEEAIAEAPVVIAGGEAVYAKVKALLTSPDVLALEAEASKIFHMVVTPTGTAVVEPKV